VGLVFWRIAPGLLAAEDGLRAGLGLGALSGLAGLAAHSALDFNLRIPSNALLAALLAAIALASSPLPEWRPSRVSALLWSIALAGGLALVVSSAGPEWPEARALARRAGSGPEPASALRLQLAEERLQGVLRRRPALAEAWLLLGWTRAAAGSAEAAGELARHAVALDPRREALQREAERLVAPEPPVTPDDPPADDLDHPTGAGGSSEAGAARPAAEEGG
jgi:hypothetical protein